MRCGRQLLSYLLPPSLLLAVVTHWAVTHAAVSTVSKFTYTLQTAKLTALQASSRSTCSAAEAIYVQRCDDQPAADPACCFDCPVDPAPAEQ